MLPNRNQNKAVMDVGMKTCESFSSHAASSPHATTQFMNIFISVTINKRERLHTFTQPSADEQRKFQDFAIGSLPQLLAAHFSYTY